jgi:hypothetical protein
MVSLSLFILLACISLVIQCRASPVISGVNISDVHHAQGKHKHHHNKNPHHSSKAIEGEMPSWILNLPPFIRASNSLGVMEANLNFNNDPIYSEILPVIRDSSATDGEVRDALVHNHNNIYKSFYIDAVRVYFIAI